MFLTSLFLWHSVSWGHCAAAASAGTALTLCDPWRCAAAVAAPCAVAHSKYFTFRFTFTFAFAFELEFTFEFSLVLPWHFRVLSALPAAACCMPQRMLHLLHVVTAFMAKWLAGHGHLTCISLSFWVSCNRVLPRPVFPLVLCKPFCCNHTPFAPSRSPAPSFCCCVSRTSNSHVSKML